ncbi:MAG: tryptophan--tRNA ligase [Archangium gephyra]|uniref:Tryptophan--tRNA ligase n=1 Tax=Archangium gephyra TaxID=48 RepID=A0A2W5UXI7_9BACT|nr:MAG: tryptophan--tRNA ligase [Archangium gephyra]
MRILSGVQSSGKLHIGNYYGAIREFVSMQNEGEALYFIANLHALNSVRDGKLARELTYETAAAFLALGIDPDRAALFRQSDVPEITELYWILGTVVPVADLENAHSYKDKLANKASPDFGLFAYPVLMAADILLYDSDVVPVGRDQRQHLELTRDWAAKFNRQYAPTWDSQKGTGGIFKLPAGRTRDETAVVPGRDGRKMSKSYANTIDLFGTDGELKKQVMSVKTDSTLPEAAKPLADQPLYDLLKVSLSPADFAIIDAKWREAGGTPQTHGYGGFKTSLLEAFHGTFDPARKRYAELMNDRAELERLLKKGAEKARGYAAPVIDRVRVAVGL